MTRNGSPMLLIYMVCFGIIAMLHSCKDPEPAYTHKPKVRLERGACMEAFHTVQGVWARMRGDVLARCKELELEYEIELVGELHTPCTDDVGTLFPSCTDLAKKKMYIGAWRDERSRVALAVHEWVHILSACELKDDDKEHRFAGLWINPVSPTVESRALSYALLGPCL